MPTAVVLFLTDEGEMMVGEVDPSTVNPQEFQPVTTFEEAVEIAEKLTMGEEPSPDIMETAFNKSVNAPNKGPMAMEEEGEY